MKRLYKSRSDRVIAGVCGGVGEYFNIDPVLVRIVWVLLSVLGGSGILAYIIGIIIIPEAPESVADEAEVKQSRAGRTSSQTVWGIILIAIGLLFLLSQFDLFRYFSSRFWFISWSVIFPIFLVILGAIILFRRGWHKAEGEDSEGAGEAAEGDQGTNHLYRLRNERKLAGVCAGLAYYLKIDPTIVRLLWVIGVFATGGVAILLYIIMAVVLPESEVTFDEEAGANA